MPNAPEADAAPAPARPAATSTPEIGAIIAADPGASATLLALAGRRHVKHRRAEEVAATLLVGLYAHARDIAQGKPFAGPFAGISRLKDHAKASNVALSDEDREMLAGVLAEMDEEIKNAGPNNQPVPEQSDPQYGNNPD